MLLSIFLLIIAAATTYAWIRAETLLKLKNHQLTEAAYETRLVKQRVLQLEEKLKSVSTNSQNLNSTVRKISYVMDGAKDNEKQTLNSIDTIIKKTGTDAVPNKVRQVPTRRTERERSEFINRIKSKISEKPR
ncbi:MAG: hypothetical protein OEY38_05285 [Gammaproteobacteria bacterium]|nr:hypothetical protein [Gammaproteobacteria bacterium]